MITLQHGGVIFKILEDSRVKWLFEYEGLYAICEKGYILTCKGKIRKLKPLKRSHRRGVCYGVCLCKNGEVVEKKISHLILTTFVGPRPEGLVACHYDDDTTNNNLKNLRWATRTENNLDALRNGKGPRQKLSINDVLDIRIQLKKGRTQKVISEEYGVSQSNIANIKAKRIWRHI